MKYIVYDKFTNQVEHILDKQPIQTSALLGVAECTAIPNAKYLVATNIKNHEETYKVVECDYDDNGNEIPKEVEKVRKWQTCDLVEDIDRSRKYALKTEIVELKAKLSATDYIVLKIAEKTLYGEDVSELTKLYSTELKNRQEWRCRINAIEKELQNAL